MSTSRPRQPPPPTRTLCLGEALVDMICERHLNDLGEAGAFVPHFGGVVANVAMVAARYGARVALVGAVGADPWGGWLRDRLEAGGVDTSLLALLPDAQTPVAFVTVHPDGEARYTLYGDAPELFSRAIGDGIEEAVESSAALFLTSNTLAGAAEREISMRARERALRLSRPVIFDANLRLHRWRSHADAAASSNACVPRALLVRANVREAALMTGEDDVERAAQSLLKAGAQNVVITLGRRGAILRGKLRVDVPGVAAEPVCTVGAGDVLTGVLLARLAGSGFYAPAVAASLREAVAAAAEACQRWGALD